MKSELTTLILEILQGMDEIYQPADGNWTADTPLFGDEGVLDSIGLVTMIVAVEQAIGDRYKLFVALADERAFSQKNSPFRTVDSLAEYAAQIVELETK